MEDEQRAHERAHGFFLLDQDGLQTGPFRGEQLAAMLASGELVENRLCWRAGMDAWAPLERSLLQADEAEAEDPAARRVRPPPPRADGVARLSQQALPHDAASAMERRRILRASRAVPPAASLDPSAALPDEPPRAPVAVHAAVAPGESGGRPSTRLGALSATIGAVAVGVVGAVGAPVRQLQRLALGWAEPAATGAGEALAAAVSSAEAAAAAASEAARSHGAGARHAPSGSVAAAAAPPPPAAGPGPGPSPGLSFGQPLARLASPEGGGDGRVPALFAALVAHLALPQVLRTDGLFRVPAEHVRVRSLHARLDGGEPVACVLAELQRQPGGDAHVAAALLKAFLRELPEPVCTHAAHPGFVRAAAELSSDAEGCVRALRQLVRSLPAVHCETLRDTCALLGMVAAAEAHNLMGVRALATIFAPNLLRPGGAASCLDELHQLAHTTAVVRILVERQLDIFAPEPAPEPGGLS